MTLLLTPPSPVERLLSVFGGAKPVDTAAGETEVEEWRGEEGAGDVAASAGQARTRWPIPAETPKLAG